MATMTTTKAHAWMSHFDEEPSPASAPPSPIKKVDSSSAPSAAPFKRLYDVKDLLADPIIYISPQSGQYLTNETSKYTPINPSPASARPSTASNTTSPVASTSAVPYGAAPPPLVANKAVPSSSLTLDGRWPASCRQPGPGWQNTGNTCFLNSSLQAILHTPPLVGALLSNAHSPATCKQSKSKGYCALCAAVELANEAYTARKRGASVPRVLTSNLTRFSKTLRHGRQEDSHEFLRFCVDAMMNAELVGVSPKEASILREDTLIHRIFGGRFRSRVQCKVCQHPSDTFDHFMDLSLDVKGLQTIERALERFRRSDILKYPNQYKCEKCKKLVNAEKTFAIDEAPMALTIHLKRFEANGRKITDLVKYPALLNLGPAMCDQRERPTYSLYGVVCHLGSGPHSGHYYAYVKAADGQWYKMDDDSVDRISQDPLSSKAAYMLFYIRAAGDKLTSAVNNISSTAPPRALPSFTRANGTLSPALSANGVKRKADEDDLGEAISSPAPKRPVLGPHLPARDTMPPPTSSSLAPQSAASSPLASFQPDSNRFAPLSTSSSPGSAPAPVAAFYGSKNSSTSSLKATSGPGSRSLAGPHGHAFRQPPSSSSSTGGGYTNGFGGGRGSRGRGGYNGHRQGPPHQKGMTQRMAPKQQPRV